MGLFNKNKSGGFMDVIRCDEPSYLIWKWHPTGSQPVNNDRENAIRWGSSLRVKDGSVAVFVYKQKNGTVQDFIEGPFDEIIKTSNFPILANIVGLAYDGGTPFQAEIYFINLARVNQINFAVPFFDVFDPRFLDFGVPTAVRGTMTFKINDYREFIKLHRLDSFDLDDFQRQIKDAIIRYTKNAIANTPSDHNIPVLQLERKISLINDIVESIVKKRLIDDFGVAVSGVDIGTIEIDKASDGYKQLMSVTQEVSTATIQAQTAVNIKQMQDKQRIEAENYEGTLRIQREEGQYAQHKQTQTTNYAAYQVEAQKEVGVAGANALGQMGANNACDMSGGGGFNPANMMVGMAIGGAMGQNIAGTMNNMMAGVNQPPQTGMLPPPIPITGYYIAVDGKQSGPYDISILAQMAVTGLLLANSLVWKTGMNAWVQANSVNELKSVFIDTPPIPPME